MNSSWRAVALGVVLGAVAVSLAISAGGSLLQSSGDWAQYYMVKQRCKITSQDLPFISFIPSFGDSTMQAIRSELPITSAGQLEVAVGGGKRFDMLMALYDLSPSCTPPDKQDGEEESEGEDSSGRMAFTEPAEVIRIRDGDTFVVEWPNGRVEPIRPASIDTPETPNECYAREAKEFTESFLLGRTVWLDRGDPNQLRSDDRLLAKVWLDAAETASFGRIMVSQGFARVLTEFPRGQELAQVGLEDEAQEANRGLWEACN